MSAKLRLVKPVAITPAMLVSCSVPEDDHPAWVSGTTYAVGAYVLRPNHKIYRRLIGGAGTTAPELDPTNWLDAGYTNRWRSLDESNTSATSYAGDIVYTLTPGSIIQTIALLNVVGASVRVQMTDPVDGAVYDKTITLISPISEAAWWTYFFEDITASTQALFFHLPAYRTATYTITIAASSGQSACGVLLLGKQLILGRGIQYGAKLGITDFSRKEADEFGNYALIKRSWNRKAWYDMLVDNRDLDKVQVELASVRATACLWIGADRYASSIIYGFYKDFSTVIAYPDLSQLSIEIEGLT